MEVKEFLETQGNDEKDIKKAKECVLENAIYVNQDTSLFEEPSEQVLNHLGTSIVELCNVFGCTVRKEDVSIPKHYNGNKDVIQYLQEDVFSKEQFVGSMIFNIVKYTTRLGRKDNNYKELLKVYTYYVRLREGLSLYE